MACSISPFEGGRHYHHYSYHSLTSGQTTGREHSPIHQQNIGLKIYWAWPCPPEQDSVFPTASPSHQEACTSLLSLSIRGQTWNKNRNHRKLNKLFTWITALSNSMKLWAMPFRATQDGWVMVESSEKELSILEGKENHFILALRTLWTVWKGIHGYPSPIRTWSLGHLTLRRLEIIRCLGV